MSKNKTRPSWEIVRDIANGYYMSRILYVATKLSLADLIADGTTCVESLAEATQTHPNSLYRLLRALSNEGIFQEEENRRFTLNPLSECLRAEAKISLKSNIIFRGEPWFWNAWGNLMHSVKTGNAAFPVSNGLGFFEFCDQNPDALKVFQAAMLEGTDTASELIVDLYDFSSFETIMDVGGGFGGLISKILTKHHNAKGVLFDLPSVLESSVIYLKEAGILDRCETVAGNFFESIPSGADCYVLKSVLHDWPAKETEQILTNCRKAMKKGAKIVLIEHIVPDRHTSHWSKIGDINTWVISGGRELTAQEYNILLEKTGFKLTNIIEPPSGRYVIEAIPVFPE